MLVGNCTLKDGFIRLYQCMNPSYPLITLLYAHAISGSWTNL